METNDEISMFNPDESIHREMTECVRRETQKQNRRSGEREKH